MITINPPLKGELVHIGDNCRVHSAMIKTITCRKATSAVIVTFLDDSTLVVDFNALDLDEAFQQAISQWEDTLEN